MQRDTTGLTSENKELKLRLQAMEQQAELREGMPFFQPCFWYLWRELDELQVKTRKQ